MSDNQTKVTNSTDEYGTALNHYQHKIDNYIQEIRTHLRTLCIIFCICITYLSLGSLLFLYIEECYDVTETPINTLRLLEVGFHRICDELAAKNASLMINNSLHEELSDICRQTMDQLPVSLCEVTLDGFVKWLEYTITIAFTIGYGYVVCHSTTGRIVTIFYTVPAIAVTIKFYVSAGDILVKLSRIVFITFEVKVLKRSRIQYVQAKVLATQIILFFFFWTCIMLTNIPLIQDGYTYFDALYLSFITLTTVGFGDLQYGFDKSLSQPYIFILTSIFYLFGVGALASVLTEISQFGGTEEEPGCQHCRRDDDDKQKQCTKGEKINLKSSGEQHSRFHLPRMSPLGMDSPGGKTPLRGQQESLGVRQSRKDEYWKTEYMNKTDNENYVNSFAHHDPMMPSENNNALVYKNLKQITERKKGIKSELQAIGRDNEGIVLY